MVLIDLYPGAILAKSSGALATENIAGTINNSASADISIQFERNRENTIAILSALIQRSFVAPILLNSSPLIPAETP
jgi:hypothetical protein